MDTFIIWDIYCITKISLWWRDENIPSPWKLFQKLNSKRTSVFNKKQADWTQEKQPPNLIHLNLSLPNYWEIRLFNSWCVWTSLVNTVIWKYKIYKKKLFDGVLPLNRQEIRTNLCCLLFLFVIGVCAALHIYTTWNQQHNAYDFQQK